jgi:2-haloacid dehalogenase
VTAAAAAPLEPVRAFVFDAYGTLFDVASAAARHRETLGDRHVALSQLWRQKQLEYTWLRTLMGRHADFAEVTADALDYALEALTLPTELRDRLLEIYLRLDAYPDAAPTLTRLRERGLKIAILSNGTPSMLEAIVKQAQLERLFDELLSIESVGSFKPVPAVYQLAVDRLGVEAARIGFVSANGWDAAGASAFGFRTVWVNRTGAPVDRLPARPHAQIRQLAELHHLLGLAT